MFKKIDPKRILAVVAMAGMVLSVFAVMLMVPAVYGAHTAYAAGISTTSPDADFANALQSGVAVVNLQKALILGFVVAVMLVVFIVALSKGALNWMIAKIVGIFSRRRRR